MIPVPKSPIGTVSERLAASMRPCGLRVASTACAVLSWVGIAAGVTERYLQPRSDVTSFPFTTLFLAPAAVVFGVASLVTRRLPVGSSRDVIVARVSVGVAVLAFVAALVVMVVWW